MHMPIILIKIKIFIKFTNYNLYTLNKKIDKQTQYMFKV